MSAFDQLDRTLLGGASHSVGQYEYLNLSARKEAARVRVLVDDWLSRYPAKHRPDLVRKLRSVEDLVHNSAFFELMLHEMLVRSGCVVHEVEPTVPDSPKRPDFLVATPSGQLFYLEATLATGQSAARVGAQRRLNEVMAALDSVRSPNFFLAVTRRGYPTQPVSLKRLKLAVERWLEPLDYGQIVALQTAQKPRPCLRLEEHGLHLRLEVIPRQRPGGHIQGRAIAVSTLEPLSVQPYEAIRSAVVGKASRYGALPHPYVIAVNGLGQYADEDDAIDALFGCRAVAVRQTPNGFEDELCRTPDGAWQNRNGPQYTRVSAVLSTERVSPWSVGQRRARLIVNPFAVRPLPDHNFGCDIWRVEGEFLRKREGVALNDIFGLSPHWPED